MGKTTEISWTDSTFNPWIGCTKVSPGCANCYAEGESKRRGWAQWGKGKQRHRTSESYWKQPIKWNDRATYAAIDHESESNLGKDLGEYRRPRVFCASLADVFDAEVPIEWLADLFQLIRLTPNLDWQLLTKRPENWLDRVCKVFELTGQDSEHFAKWRHAHVLAEGWIGEGDACKPPDNVWIGTSVEDQTRADERIPKLLEIPARVRFLSCEPLLGPVDLSKWIVSTNHNEERQGDGEHCDEGRDCRETHREEGRDDLEAQRETSGTGHGRGISPDTLHGKRGAGLRVLSQDSLSKIQRRDSAGDHRESQERDQMGQPTTQPRVSDISGADPARQECIGYPREGSGRREELDGETSGRSSSGNQTASSSGRESQIHSEGVCNIGQERQQNRSSSEMGIHQIIVGGESGPKKRPFDCDWARCLRDQCAAAGVAFFMKQVDKKQPIPEDLLVRQFPNVP